MRCSSIWLKGVAGFALLFAVGVSAGAEDGSAAWLRYAPIPNASQYDFLPDHIMIQVETPADRSAAQELQRGLTSMLGRAFVVVPYDFNYKQRAIRLNRGPEPQENGSGRGASGAARFTSDWFVIARNSNQAGSFLLQTMTPQAELYAAFHLLEEVASEQPIRNLEFAVVQPCGGFQEVGVRVEHRR